MKYTNAQMEVMLKSLKPLLERRDIIGYAAARNSRVLRDELTEFHAKRDELVLKYGESETDEDGNPTGQFYISVASPKFSEFVDAISVFDSLEHEPNLFKIKYDEAIGKLTGTELLECEWMFED